MKSLNLSMIHYQYNYVNEIGKQTVNQDSLAIIEANHSHHQYLICILCDGLGGLSYGEVASSYIVRRMIQSIEKEFHLYLDSLLSMQQWLQKVISTINEELIQLANHKGLQMASTLSILILDNLSYLITYIGDSRIYLNGNQISQDQSIQHQLIQAIGISPHLDIPFQMGKAKRKDTFLLASDGFYSKAKINHIITPFNQSFSKVISTNLALGEMDNMSAIGVIIQ